MTTTKNPLPSDWIQGGWKEELLQYLNQKNKDVHYFRSRNVVTSKGKKIGLSQQLKKSFCGGGVILSPYLIRIYGRNKHLTYNLLFEARKVNTMKGIIVNKDKLSRVVGQEAVHFSFRPSIEEVINLSSWNPNLKIIQMSPAYNKTTSKALEAFCSHPKINIKIITGEEWGARSDIKELFNFIVPGETYKNRKTGESILVTKVDELYIHHMDGIINRREIRNNYTLESPN